MLKDEDLFGNPLEIGYLVVIAASSRYAHAPTFALYDGHTAKMYRYKVVGVKWDKQAGTYNPELVKTNLIGNRKQRSNCLLISPTTYTEEELFDIDDRGIAAIQWKGLV